MFSSARDTAQLTRMFHALADEKRVRVIDLLQRGEQCVCELSGALGVGQSLLSFHLKKLKEAGLVRDRKEGRWVYYSIDRRALARLGEFVGRSRVKGGAPRPYRAVGGESFSRAKGSMAMDGKR